LHAAGGKKCDKEQAAELWHGGIIRGAIGARGDLTMLVQMNG
jgi:hypothetical protein